MSKHHIDFKTLDAHALKQLSTKWEKEAFNFEMKFSRLLENSGYYRRGVEINKETQDKIDRLWLTGKAMWSKLHTLENYRNKVSKLKKV